MNTVYSKFVIWAIFMSTMATHAQVYILKQRYKYSYSATSSSDNTPMASLLVSGANYVATQSVDASTGKRTMLMQKVDIATGNITWTSTNVNTNNIDPVHLASYGNSVILVGANIANAQGRTDMYFARYNSLGVKQLERTYTNRTYDYEIVQKVQADQNGNIYVLGYGYKSTTQMYDMILVKYNGAGTVQYVKTYSNVATNTFTQMVVDYARNSIYISGSVGSSNSKLVTLAYNLAGTKLWESTYNGPNNINSTASDITVDANGALYVLGTSDFNYVTIKYNSINGALVWAQRYAGSLNQDVATSITVNSNSVYVTGFSRATNSMDDVVTNCYKLSDGELKWSQRYNGAFNGDDQAFSVKVDANGFVYVMATEQERAADLFGAVKDAITVLYSPNGKFMHKIDYSGYNSGVNEIPKAMIIDASGNVHLSHAVGNVGNTVASRVKYGKINCFGPEGVTGTGTPPNAVTGVLRFASEEIFDLILDSLGRAEDDSVTFTQLQLNNSYKSLYQKLDDDEVAILNTGVFLDETNDPDNNNFIADEDLRAVLNDKSEMIIGTTLYKFIDESTSLTIENPTKTLLDSVRANIPMAFKNARVTRVSNQMYNGGGLVNCLDFYYEIPYPANWWRVVFRPYQSDAVNEIVWNFGDGTPEITQGITINPYHSYANPGTYTVTAKLVGGACDGQTISHQVNIGSDLCNAAFEVTSIDDLKAGFTDYSTIIGGGVTATWDYGDGSEPSTSGPQYYTYATDGIKTVTLTLVGTGCSSSYSVNIVVSDPNDGLPNTAACSKKDCDKRESKKSTYHEYIPNERAIIGKAYYGNYSIGIWRYRKVGAKNKHYIKLGGKWRKRKATKLEYNITGSVMLSNRETWKSWTPDIYIRRNCKKQQDITLYSGHYKKTEGEKKCKGSFNIFDPNAAANNDTAASKKVKFGVCKFGLSYEFAVTYNGNIYSPLVIQLYE